MLLRTLALLLPLSAFGAPIDFAREVLPILSDACFHCHGPDEAKAEADLRLDKKEGLYRTLDGVTVVAPGKPEASELVLRITSKDRDEVMPPPKAVRQLKPAEIETLRRWVAEGAPYGQHWAFEPMKPHDAQASIDQLLPSPGPEATPERLARRLAFDLTGLPPTLEQIAAFDKSYGANKSYVTYVDTLLASPRFGEHLAADWMDVARFADTHGYQYDAPRPLWPWRDWVIDAFNRNLPFDQFVTWQLAGDLLPGATQEQKLATAFNRLHMQNEEGGIVEEEFRVAYVVDRVNTFATAFLGLTTECTRCHDHKYDPLTQRDFFSLFAFFQNIDEAGQNPYTGFVNDMPEPTLLLATSEQQARLAALAQQIAAKEDEWPALAKAAATAPRSMGVSPAPPLPGEVVRHDFESLEQKPGKPHESPKLIDGKMGKAALLDGEDGFTFPKAGDFHRAQEFSLSLWLRPAKHVPRAVVVHHTRAPVDAGSRGYELLLENGRASFALNHLWPGNALRVTTKAPLAENKWTHLVATYDGSSRASGVRLFVDGLHAEVEVVRDGLTKDITPGDGELTIGYRFRDNGFKDGAVDDFRVFGRALTALEAAHLAGRSETSEAARFEHFLATVHEPAKAWRAELAKLRDEQRKFIQPIPEIMVMHELPQPKRAFILQRGAYDSPGAEVTADTPAVLPVFPKDAPRNRLGLARWLLDPEHPLMARVTVNRLWQMMFGTGLVETAENFGTQGAQPANRALLDWLARDFIAHGWDVKRTLKQIALSAAYRQSTNPPRRLTAEMLRDQALAASGLLVGKIGGPSVKPYQPPGLWEEIAMGKPRYGQGKGDDLHRRSLYTFWKRTVPPPAMMTFDAADRSNCSVRRQSTSTPLQALALLNDVQIAEAARHLAARMLREGGATAAEQTAWAFRTVTSRRPTDKETAILVRLLDEQRGIFAQDTAATAKLLAFGQTPTDPALPAADLAAGTVLALAIFNHDEAVTRR